MYRNICILALCVISASALSLKASEEVDPLITKCAQENGLDPQTASQTTSDVDEYMNNRKAKCFSACLLKARGLLKPDGTFNAAVSICSIPHDIPNRDKVVEAFNECSNEKDDDECETAYKISRCLASKSAIPKRSHNVDE